MSLVVESPALTTRVRLLIVLIRGSIPTREAYRSNLSQLILPTRNRFFDMSIRMVVPKTDDKIAYLP